MAYEAHKWKIGEEITSEKLNHIEKGIEEAGLPREITDPQDGQTLKYDAEKGKWVNGEGGSGGGTSRLVVTETLNESNYYVLDKTFQEIADAFPNVALKSVNSNDQTQYVLYPAYRIEVFNGYKVYTTNGTDDVVLEAASLDDYPKRDGSMG